MCRIWWRRHLPSPTPVPPGKPRPHCLLNPGPSLCALPTGVKRCLVEHASLTPEEEEYVSGVLDELYSAIPRQQHAYVSGQPACFPCLGLKAAQSLHNL